jgi:hypothetical protein
MVVAVTALVMSTAGTATAAKLLITSSSQIKAGSVNSGDVRDRSLRGGDLKEGTIGADEIRNGGIGLSELDTAVQAAVSSSQVKATEAFRKAGPENVAQGKVERVATVQALDPGVYAIFAKTTLTGTPRQSSLFASGESSGGHCALDAAGDKDEARAVLAGPGFNAPATLNLQVTRTFGEPGTITLDCDVSQQQWRASDTSIIAVKLSAAPKVSVDG